MYCCQEPESDAHHMTTKPPSNSSAASQGGAPPGAAEAPTAMGPHTASPLPVLRQQGWKPSPSLTTVNAPSLKARLRASLTPYLPLVIYLPQTHQYRHGQLRTARTAGLTAPQRQRNAGVVLGTHLPRANGAPLVGPMEPIDLLAAQIAHEHLHLSRLLFSC